jgi:hypothetical protein
MPEFGTGDVGICQGPLRAKSSHSIACTPPNLRCDFPPGASTNDIAGQILDSKKLLKTSSFQGLCLVAGVRDTRFLRLVERVIPRLAA